MGVVIIQRNIDTLPAPVAAAGSPAGKYSSIFRDIQLLIHQSYLSKLENDKSQPSAEMFSAIIKSLELSAQDFLNDIDRKILQGSLRHIPEVSQFLTGVATRRVHDARKYLYSAAAACAIGFALMLASNDGIFFPNNLYKYSSEGVNRVLQYLGALLTFCGLLAVVVEWRLRKTGAGVEIPSK